MSTPNLAIPHIAAAQNQKEVTANDAFDRLDEAITGRLTVDLAAGDVTLTASKFRQHVAFAAINVMLARAAPTISAGLGCPPSSPDSR